MAENIFSDDQKKGLEEDILDNIQKGNYEIRKEKLADFIIIKFTSFIIVVKISKINENTMIDICEFEHYVKYDDFGRILITEKIKNLCRWNCGDFYAAEISKFLGSCYDEKIARDKRRRI